MDVDINAAENIAALRVSISIPEAPIACSLVPVAVLGIKISSA